MKLQLIRILLTLGSLLCAICGTTAICQVRSVPELNFQVNALTARVDETKGFEVRLIKLEDGVKVHSDQLTEITWWARGIGFALILGVMEKVFKIAAPKTGTAE